ncbi:hypothetical protein MA16_Dca019739 [Dendrobium catenatum]|uniref:Uncharacterized protein n=1 Tax=Dendrobium catenatum TaxID=906689 RepID=A0A2I0VQR5_9ASPA|nr:hypothetical protein MA16_Dca019739 [Dendrobium catenatum]
MAMKSRIGRPTGFFYRVLLLMDSIPSRSTKIPQARTTILRSSPFNRSPTCGTEDSVTLHCKYWPPSPHGILRFIRHLIQILAILVKWPKAIDYIFLLLKL